MTDYYCPFCKAPLRIEQGHRFTLTIWALIIFICITAFGIKWVLWHFFAPGTALALWTAVVILLIGILVAVFSRQVKYVPRP